MSFGAKLFRTSSVTHIQSLLDGLREENPVLYVGASYEHMRNLGFHVWALGTISPCSIKECQGFYPFMFHISCSFNNFVIDLMALLQLQICDVSSDKR
jgi:hypothetical protein